MEFHGQFCSSMGGVEDEGVRGGQEAAAEVFRGSCGVRKGQG